MHLSPSFPAKSFSKPKRRLKVCSPGAKRARGFTLLELLAVIFIIGIIISFANLSVGQNTSRVLQDEAERLHGLVRLAGEEAVLQGRELALEFGRGRYRFLELGTEDWQPVEADKLLRERPLPAGIRLELVVEGVDASFDGDVDKSGYDKEHPPRIFVLSSGELTPFQLTLSIDDGGEYLLEGRIDGKLTLTRSKDDEA